MSALLSIGTFFKKTYRFFDHYIPPVTTISASFLLLSLVVPSNKFLFVLSALYLMAQYAATRSFMLTLLYSFMPLSLMEVGQMYIFNVVPSVPLSPGNPDYTQGRSLFFIFSPFFAFCITSLVGIFVILLQKRQRWNTPAVIAVLVGMSSLGVISSLRSAFLPQLSVGYSFVELGNVAWLWLVWVFVRSRPLVFQHRVRALLLEQIMVVGIFHAGIVLAQFFTRSALGLVIERTQQLPVFGLGPDESFLQFRPLGLLEHANNLANHLITLVVAALALHLTGGTKRRAVWRQRLVFVFYVLTGIALVLTLSRAAYLGIGLFIIGIFLFARLTFDTAVSFLKKQWQRHRFWGYGLVFLLTPTVLTRIWQSFASFETGGGAGVRHRLTELSGALFQKYFWWGTGQGMFIPAGYALNPRGIMASFPESVHNGWLLFAVERGMVGFIALAVFIYLVVRRIFFSSLPKNKKTLLLLGFVPLLAMMQFHPFFNVVSVYTFIVLLIV